MNQKELAEFEENTPENDIWEFAISLSYSEIRRLEKLEEINYQKSSRAIVGKVMDFTKELKSKKIITEENYLKDLSYNVPFWVQALIKNIDANLRYDSPDQTEYPHEIVSVVSVTKNQVIDTLLAYLPNKIVWKYLLKNYTQVESHFLKLIEDLESWKHNKVIFLSNHATWLNLPLIAFFLIESDIVDHNELYTILAPAIMATHSTLAWAVREWWALKSWANTPRWATGYEYRKSIVKAFMRVMNEKNKMDRIFYLLSPSGTTDKSNNEQIILWNPTDGTQSLLDKLKMEGFVFVSIWINDLEVMSWNSRLRPGNIYMKYSIHRDPCRALEELPWNVVNSNRESIGTWKGDEKTVQ